MKSILKKNQIIITSLAILIAIAGYLNYTEKNVNNNQKKSEQVNDEAVAPENNNFTGNDLNSEPGEAVFTNAGTFSAGARLNREQIRSQNKEALIQTLENEQLSEEQKSEITSEIIKITETAEMENEIETLLEAKGYSEVVVTIGEENVDVVLNMQNVDDTMRAQIEDTVMRKTGRSSSQIIITPVNLESK